MWDSITQQILDYLDIADPQLLGKGGEGMVFALDKSHVVKIVGAQRAYLEALQAFQHAVAAADLPYDLPQIEEIGQHAGRYYTIEKRLHGTTLDQLLPSLTQEQQNIALENYFKAVRALGEIMLPGHAYRHLLPTEQSFTSDHWPQFIIERFAQRVKRAQRDLKHDVAQLEHKVDLFTNAARNLLVDVPKCLVHGDYFPGNIMVDEQLQVTAVIDFSPHTLVGDHRLDAAGAICFLTLYDFIVPEQIESLKAQAVQIYGAGITTMLALYTVYYSAYFSDTARSDPPTYQWCIRNWQDEDLCQMLASAIL